LEIYNKEIIVPEPEPTPAQDIDITDGENVKIVNVQYPAVAHKGDEFEVTVYFMNVGTDPCEIRTQLIDVMTRKVIDTVPDIMFHEQLAPGQSMSLTLSTDWNIGAMPDHDWKLQVDVNEINRLTNATQKTHDTRTFTVKHDDEPIDPWYDPIVDPVVDIIEDVIEDITDPEHDTPEEHKLTIDVPRVTIAGDVAVSGTALPGDSVQIVVSEAKYGIDILAADTVLRTVVADGDGRYSATVTLNDFGLIGLYARVKKTGFDKKSTEQSVWVITYPIIAVVGLMTLMVYDKMSGGRLRNMIMRGKK
jgi:hypothetical protein